MGVSPAGDKTKSIKSDPGCQGNIWSASTFTWTLVHHEQNNGALLIMLVLENTLHHILRVCCKLASRYARPVRCDVSMQPVTLTVVTQGFYDECL